MKQLIFLLVLLCALGLLALSVGTPIAQAGSANNENARPAIISASSKIEEMTAFDAAGPAPESQAVPFNETPGPLAGGGRRGPGGVGPWGPRERRREGRAHHGRRHRGKRRRRTAIR